MDEVLEASILTTLPGIVGNKEKWVDGWIIDNVTLINYTIVLLVSGKLNLMVYVYKKNNVKL